MTKAVRVRSSAPPIGLDKLIIRNREVILTAPK
jgi:hypothetical protein